MITVRAAAANSKEIQKYQTYHIPVTFESNNYEVNSCFENSLNKIIYIRTYIIMYNGMINATYLFSLR